jgi:hypothetical protein
MLPASGPGVKGLGVKRPLWTKEAIPSVETKEEGAWPLEQPAESKERDQHERVHQLIRVLHEGATEMAWSTRYDVDDGLTWDAKREVWVGSDGFAYDGERLFDYSRGGRGIPNG